MKRFIKRQFQQIRKGGISEFLRKIKLLLRKISKILIFNLTWIYRLLNLPLLKFYQFFTPTIYIEDFTAYLRTISSNEHSLAKRNKQAKKKIRIFTKVWGKYLYLYDVILMRSLFQSGNLIDLLENGYEITLSVHILESDALTLQKIISKFLMTLPNQHIDKLNVDLVQYTSEIDIIEYSLIANIKSCISEASSCIMASPDIFFGDFSLSNIVKINMDRDLCIAAVHFRVNQDDFLELLGLSEGLISNPSLVELSMRSAHQTLRDSFLEKENCSFLSGLAVQRLSGSSFAVTSRLPTVFLANFNESDLKYFGSHEFNSWDHEWPTKLMIEGRYKCIGSSDVFFAAEPTNPKTHLCTLNSAIGNDDYQAHQTLHKEVNRNFVVIVTSTLTLNKNTLP